MLRILILLFFFGHMPFALQAATYTLEQRFATAQAGDFIVTAQENHYSLLFIRSITPDVLLLEEISVPRHQMNLKKIRWKDWVSNKAPGHTSWILYEMDRKNGKLIECFSYSKNGWLYLDESEQFLTRLLTLQLHLVPDHERRKIGPPPTTLEEDRRAIWNPPLVIEGKKIVKPSFDVLKAQWPDDASRLSRCWIELYFIKDFPFPFWFEVQSPHYAFKIRTVDSGHNLVSPMIGPMPHRAPHILGLAQKGLDQWKLAIKTPIYFQKLHLYVIDLTAESKSIIPIPFLLQHKLKEEWFLDIKTTDLNKLLQHQHRYKWALIPEGSTDIYVESEETFTF